MAKRALSGIFIAFTLLLAGCDHLTKTAALHELGKGGSIPVVSGVLELRYVENHDTAFSLLQNITLPGKPIILTALASIALIALAFAWWKRRRTASLIEHLGYSAILAGAIGNVTERAYRGHVIDFISLKHWPVFNVADILIVVGFALIVIAGSSTKWRPRTA